MAVGVIKIGVRYEAVEVANKMQNRETIVSSPRLCVREELFQPIKHTALSSNLAVSLLWLGAKDFF